MKIMPFKMPYTKFIPYDSNLTWITISMMLMSNWYNTCTIYEFEGTFDPSYLQLDKNNKDAWKTYAEKVINLLS